MKWKRRPPLPPAAPSPLTCHEYKNVYTCRATFSTALRRMDMPHIHVKTLNGKVYLINDLVPRRRPLPGDPPHKPKVINIYRRRTGKWSDGI